LILGILYSLWSPRLCNLAAFPEKKHVLCIRSLLSNYDMQICRIRVNYNTQPELLVLYPWPCEIELLYTVPHNRLPVKETP
jgi:hypothetical protein